MNNIQYNCCYDILQMVRKGIVLRQLKKRMTKCPKCRDYYDPFWLPVHIKGCGSIFCPKIRFIQFENDLMKGYDDIHLKKKI